MSIELVNMTKENDICRNIVREIIKFGVSERQLWYIVYLLGLEMENIQDAQALSHFVREHKSDAFMPRPENNG